MTDLTHLDALRARLAHEIAYLADAKTAKEKASRGIWIAQTRREIASEMKFLGIEDAPGCNLSDDELLAALEG